MDWLVSHGIRIGVLLLLALLASWTARRTIPRAVRVALARRRVDEMEEPHEAIALEEQAKRSQTLSSVLVKTVEITAFLLAGSSRSARPASSSGR